MGDHAQIFNHEWADSRNLKLEILSPMHIKTNKKNCSNFHVCNNYTDDLKRFKTNDKKTFLHLCVLCEKEYLEDNYCWFCYTIYIGDISDNKTWIECANETCDRWIHTECEAKHGVYKNFEKAYKQKGFHYNCPACLKKIK